MRLDEFVEGLGYDEAAERRRLAEEKSYEITDYIDRVEDRFDDVVTGDSLVGSTSPSIFVGRSGYPDVSTGVLSPVGDEEDAEDYVTDGNWYQQGYSIDDVFQRRTGLMNSQRRSKVDVEDVWDGFVGAQREVAIADRPVDVEIGLDGRPELDMDVDEIAAPTGPNVSAESVDLTENPYVPRPVKKTLEDDDWQAQGAMTYLYRRGFDVYDINKILSAGALGQGENRKLVPTRWSITAVDDTIGQYLRGKIRNSPSIDETQVWYNEFMGNRFWIVLSPGQWEFELVEMKAPGSVWNPNTDTGYWMSSASEGYEGRTGYVDETAGAYYASRLGVLEHLVDEDRQAKCIVLREVTDDYWAPVGVWQIRESVRNAFDPDAGRESPAGPETPPELAGEYATAESFHDAIKGLGPRLPVSIADLRRKSDMVAGLQAQLTDF
ncbi:DNA repair protein NreA [Natronoarchaeum mannanilyticum]|uniref:DNA repair protein n=1 Tax=Natronoarchaeum mannanilyticum TaxID=926360 RepID=A0AAV3T5I0_9EURY